MKRILLYVILMSFVLLVAEEAPIRQAYQSGYRPFHYSCGDGAEIVFWTDTPFGHADIFAQKISSTGETLWPEPIIVVGNPGDQRLLDAVATTDGNYILLWGEYELETTHQLRVQKIDPQGQRLWMPDGVLITVPEFSLGKAVLAPNAIGGVFVVYTNQFVPGIVSGQNYSATGDPQWTANTSLFMHSSDVELLGAVSDGAGGVIVNLRKFQNSAFRNHLLRLSAQGEVIGNDPLVSHDLFAQSNFTIMAGAPGQFILWQLYEYPQYSIRVRKIDNQGALLPVQSTQFSLGSIDYLCDLKLAASPDGGMILAWSGTDADFAPFVKLQKLGSTLLPLWQTGGVDLAADPDEVFQISLDAHPNGNTWLAWYERHEQAPPGSYYCSKAQIVGTDGQVAWETGGKLIADGASSPIVFASEDRALYLWALNSEGHNSIRRQVINTSGTPYLPEEGLPLLQRLYGQAYLNEVIALQDRYFCVWQDTRWGSRVYYQIVDQNQNDLLEPGGRALPVGRIAKSAVKVSDSSVAVLLWDLVDGVSYFYVQLIDSDGNCLYPGNGIMLTFDIPGSGNDTRLSSDNGDIYLSWVELSPDYTLHYIKGQRIHNGQKMWGANGRILHSYTGNYFIQNFGFSGRYLVWALEDNTGNQDGCRTMLYDVNGEPAVGWPADGVSVVDVPPSFYSQSVASMGLLGQDLVAFVDIPTESINVQRIDTMGNRLWTDTGTAVQSPGQNLWLMDAEYASGIAFVIMEGDNLYFQQIDAGGVLSHPGIGNQIAANQNILYATELLRFSDGNWLCAWAALTSNLIQSRNLYMRQISAEGTPQGTEPQVLCDARYKQYQQQGAVIGNQALIAWSDDRAGIMNSETAYTGVWANMINSAGSPVADPHCTPAIISLAANYPNPFNPSTTIPFSLPAGGNASLRVCNLKGQVVKTLVQNQAFSAGQHQVMWDGRDNNGKAVSSGIYIFSLDCGNRSLSRKMVLAK
jgi:hypothetical protein